MVPTGTNIFTFVMSLYIFHLEGEAGEDAVHVCVCVCASRPSTS